MSRSRPTRRLPAGRAVITLALLAVLGATALVATAGSAAAQASSRDGVAPLRRAQTGGLAHRYIVVLSGPLPSHPTKRSERKARAEDERIAASVNAKPLYEYEVDVRGFAARLTHSQLRRLRRHPKVKYIEQDERVTEMSTETPAVWSLDRIDQRSLPLDNTYTYSSEGAGVRIYIIDTGLQTSNPEFGGRAHNLLRNGVDMLGGNGSDCNGHGTHVAGIAGGKEWGVAKRATLVGVRVLSCSGSGSTASVISGMELAVKDSVGKGPSVANMSLGGGLSPTMNSAASNMVAQGMFLSVAAGNDNKNACNYSPASEPAAFTTAATDNRDTKATFSNFGTCVDAWAPGVAITAAWIANGGVNTISGTSMAAPAVAGVAALYLSDHAATPAATATWLRDHATSGAVKNIPSTPPTPNLLLYMGGL